jgi:hypothetical protein
MESLYVYLAPIIVRVAFKKLNVKLVEQTPIEIYYLIVSVRRAIMTLVLNNVKNAISGVTLASQHQPVLNVSLIPTEIFHLIVNVK